MNTPQTGTFGARIVEMIIIAALVGVVTYVTTSIRMSEQIAALQQSTTELNAATMKLNDTVNLIQRTAATTAARMDAVEYRLDRIERTSNQRE